MFNRAISCPKCGYNGCIREYPLFNSSDKKPSGYIYECSCGYSWQDPKPVKYLEYHAPKEIEERRKQTLPKLTKEDWIELQIDIYEFERGHTI